MKKLRVGVITGAFGIRGDVKLKYWLENYQDLKKYSPFEDSLGNSYCVVSARSSKSGEAHVTLKNITDRNQAEALKGTEFFMDRDKLKAPSDEDDFYVEDLIGLEVRSTNGDNVGTVLYIHNFGAGDLMEIKLSSAQDIMVPFTKLVVPSININDGFVEISQEFLDDFMKEEPQE
jgi:16S rRNA processing protein RimM